jgi:Flp pilus assembly protein CpaB
VTRFGRLPQTRRPVQLRRQRPGLRRWLSAGIVALAVAFGLHALAPAPPAHVPVLVAARDLPAGHRLQDGDLRVAAWAPGSVPEGRRSSSAAAVGRLTAGPLPRGAPVTDAGLVGPGLLLGQPSDVLAVPVRISAGSVAGLVSRGDRVDVISTVTSETVVAGALVLAEPAQPAAGSGAGLDLGAAEADGAGSGLDGDAVVLGVRLGEAQRLAHAEAVGALTIAVHPR